MEFDNSSMICNKSNNNNDADLTEDPDFSVVDLQSKTCDDLNDVKEFSNDNKVCKFNFKETATVISSTDSNVNYCTTYINNFNNDVEGSVNASDVCSSCSYNFKTNELIKMDNCDHFLCLSCRFLPGNVCKLCERNDRNRICAGLDLRKVCKDRLTSLENTSQVCNEKDGGGSKVKRRNIYRLPDYIDILPRNGNIESQFRCSICKSVFIHKLHAKYHEACFTGKKPLKCDMCEKSFISSSHLKYHQHTHTGDKPFKCNICGKGFIQRNKLNRHMTTHSDIKKPFRCQYCDRDFSSKQSLEHHARTHLGDRPFKCDKCQRKFCTKLNLKRHELRHAGVKNFICEDCGKGFVFKYNLKTHQKYHTNDRPHSCKVCSFSFIDRKDLVRHMQIHTDTERDYECSICIITFRRKDNLERHMKNIHPETITKYGKPQHIVSVVKVNKNLKLNVDNSKLVSVVEEISIDPQTTDEVNENKAKVVKKLEDVKMNSNTVIEVDNICNDVNQTSTPLTPKNQKVSVISSTKNVINNVSKVSKNIQKSKKKAKTVPAYRVITPPVNQLDSNNSVPTITKVTHIVHTSNTGVSNVKTLITTRNISEKSAKKKDKRSDSQQLDKTENKAIETQRIGVIKYAVRSHESRSSTETKHKCYRILKPGNNNQSVTTCSSSICSNDINSSNSIVSLNDTVSVCEPVSDIDMPVLYDNYNQNNITVSSDTNILSDCYSDVENNFMRSQIVTDNANDSILNRNLPPYDNVSESCLLADNVLDDTIRASLYLEDENNGKVYETEHEFVNNQDNILSYSWNLVNNV